ncbi:hypothetical protein [uncultured Sneathiella sp.]|uniref:hypothetical protein n=1 Tax=uncultured Sneathiella sp. TaxID=879315 RepID=UPI0030EDDC19|tara:strand:+ start:4881 stop:5840 length:960 start_codon:yes stop_codon:yes gene_type:complete
MTRKHFMGVGVKPIAFAKRRKVKAQAYLVWCQILLMLMALGLGVVAFTTGLEYVLLFFIIDETFGAELPSDPTPFKVYIMAFASIAAITAYHVQMLRDGDNTIMCVLRQVSRLMTVFFFVGIAALFINSDFSFSDGSFELTLDNDGTSWATAFREFIEPYLGLMASIAMGGLVFINLAVADVLLGLVRQKGPDLLHKRYLARTMIATCRKFLSDVRELAGVQRQLEQAHTSQRDQDIFRVASQLEGIMRPVLHEQKKLYLQMTDMRREETDVFDMESDPLPQNLPKAETLKAHIDDTEAFIARIPAIVAQCPVFNSETR